MCSVHITSIILRASPAFADRRHAPTKEVEHLGPGMDIEGAVSTIAPGIVAALREELEQLTLRVLQKRAETHGVDEKTLDELDELEKKEQREALVRLILERPIRAEPPKLPSWDKWKPWEKWELFDTCKHARDGTCDEPYGCEKGTDGTDCGEHIPPKYGARASTIGGSW